MPYFTTAEEWLEQSKLLLEARPSTTRITTKYSIKPARRPRKEAKPDEEARPPRGSLVFKTYDPASGVVLQYRTSKAAEVSRLIHSSLGRLSRGMAGVPEPPAEEAMPDAPTAPDAGNGDSVAASQAQPQQPVGGGGGKKKKKGKK
ncbi:unnamed protein product [Clonostachys solani]|uniref:SRP9 domain-containing protein n=1 Tax=Clonostachys solani TaxID=160281 RepID=A0A9N9W6Q0_9HYPO|nr:unnamed protein product [Clonostachys solani]